MGFKRDKILSPQTTVSILVRRLLARASWVSVTHLREGILAFMAYYNRTSNGPFHWTYKGPTRP
jgi:hypothetical protein